MAEYTVEQLQQMLADKQRAATPLSGVGALELIGLGACTYWLASLYRQGVCLPKGIGRDIAHRAYLLRAGLLLSHEPRLYAVPPLPIPYKAVYQFTDTASVQQAYKYLCLLGVATVMMNNQIRLEVR